MRGTLPAANLSLATDLTLETMFRTLPHDATHVGVFLAGCANQAGRLRLRALARKIWPEARIAVGSDRDSGFAAALGDRDGITVIAGTGSAVTGRKEGHIEKAGGWGQLLGDRGGGYDLAMQGLRLTLSNYDIAHDVTPLSEGILRALSLNRLEDLVNWASNADKMSVAKLAPVVFDAARNGDPDMLAAIQIGARTLADFTRAVAKRLNFETPDVELLGGLFINHPEYFDLFRDYLSDILPGARVQICTRSGAVGAARLADNDFSESEETIIAPLLEKTDPELASALTEQRNPRSENLDQLGTRETIELFVAEETEVIKALAGCKEALGTAVDLTSAALKNGGRLFYIGAGTSGRLGVLDASEIPPTFGAPPELVQGIIAGGVTALHRAVEGAEDQPEQGALALVERGLNPTDVVCGITASGRTPFVIGALKHAKEIGAKTILLTCNPKRRPGGAWDAQIDLATGPELVTGSTRLKAGTATKLALNILSTCTMVKLGKVKGNLMVNLAASNTKLRDRAVRLVSLATGCSHEKAHASLVAQHWDIRACLKEPPAN